MDEDEQLLPGFKVVKKERIVKTFLIHLYFCNMGLGRKCKPDGAELRVCRNSISGWKKMKYIKVCPYLRFTAFR